MSASNASFLLAENQGYLLGFSHIASARLNYQHYLWKDTLGFNIHPSVDVPNAARIADVAAGTGRWLVDVARDYHTAKLDGLDVDLKQAPHPHWLPKNASFRHWSIFEEPPPDLVGQYDFIHVRLLVLVVEGGEGTRPVIRRLLKLLKPGEILQWDEMDAFNMSIKKVGSQQTPALDALEEKCRANGRYDWTLNLPEYIEAEGFRNVRMYMYGDRDDLVRGFGEQHLLTMEEFAAGLARLGKLEAAAEFSRLVTQGFQETIDGAGMCIPRIVVLAEKP